MMADNDSRKMESVDHDDAPELTEAFFSAASIRDGESTIITYSDQTREGLKKWTYCLQ